MKCAGTGCLYMPDLAAVWIARLWRCKRSKRPAKELSDIKNQGKAVAKQI